jgi:hypothetical protein
LVPAGGGEVETHAAVYFTRVLLTQLNDPGNIDLQIWKPPVTDPAPDAYIAFEGDRAIASGDLREVARAAKQRLERRKDASILIFDADTGAAIDIDFRGGLAEVLSRLPERTKMPAASDEATPLISRGAGRPKLGVVAREVTLLPRHWDWLAQQRGGASVALRRLVDLARRTNEDKDRIRHAQEAAYRFMSATAGNRANYEAAVRALFADEPAGFARSIAEWPADIRKHASRLAERAFQGEEQASAASHCARSRN